MGIWGSIKNFFKKLFIKTRPGFELVLEKYKAVGIAEIKRLRSVNNGDGLHAWKDQAFSNLKSQISRDVKDVKDNWISTLIHLAYEHIQAEIEGL